LNSEASIILPFLLLAVAGISRRSVAVWAAYAGIWVTVTLGLHLALGEGGATSSFAPLWRDNLRHLPIALVNIGLFLGPLWIAALVGLRRAPLAARRTAWLIPPFVAAVGIWGYWWDVRLLMSLYPLLVPLVLSALFSPSGSREDF
jgi:hypothetical protein